MTTPELVLDIFLTFVRLGLTGFGGTNLAEMERLWGNTAG
jgi:chromate transporter